MLPRSLHHHCKRQIAAVIPRRIRFSHTTLNHSSLCFFCCSATDVAQAITSRGLSSSEGWIVKEPKLIHILRLPVNSRMMTMTTPMPIQTNFFCLAIQLWSRQRKNPILLAISAAIQVIMCLRAR